MLFANFIDSRCYQSQGSGERGTPRAPNKMSANQSPNSAEPANSTTNQPTKPVTYGTRCSTNVCDAPRGTENKMDTHNILFSRKLIIRLIQMYKEFPCLWDKDCPSYKIKPKREEAIARLTALVQEKHPTATRVHVLRKIEGLRACVRREFRKVFDSQITTPNDVHTPTLWYFNLFSFLKYQSHSEQKSKLKYEYNKNQNEVLDEADEENSNPTEEYLEFDDSSSYLLTEQEEEVPTTNMVEVNVEPSVRESDDGRKRRRVEVDDQYDAFGLIVASKLRGLQPNMRITAEKLINDVLYQAQTNGLNSSSTIYTPDPFK